MKGHIILASHQKLSFIFYTFSDSSPAGVWQAICVDSAFVDFIKNINIFPKVFNKD